MNHSTGDHEGTRTHQRGVDLRPGLHLLGCFGVTVVQAKGLTLISLRGDLDVCSVTRFRSVLHDLIDTGHQHLVLDLVSLDFMDARGLRLIAEAQRRLADSGGLLCLRSPSAMVRRLLAVTRMDDVLCLEGDVDDIFPSGHPASSHLSRGSR